MTLEHQERAALALGSLLREEEEHDEAWMKQAQAKLMAEVESKGEETSGSPVFADDRRRLAGMRGWAVAAAVAAAATFAFVWSARPTEPDALTFTVNGLNGATASRASGRVRAPSDGSRTLKFSDGSTLRVAEGGSLRVRETDEHGADVVLENGQVSSSVRHLDGASWSVFAGPYEIQVIGTRFSTDWDPETQRLVVLLDEGAVRVVGSNIEDHVALEPGQRCEATPRQTWKVTSQKAASEAPEETVLGETGADDATAAAPLLVEDQGVHPDVGVEPSGTSHPKSWSQLLANGKFKRIMDEARQRGFDDCYSGCSIAKLRALADAARYSGEVTVARKALVRLRSRSPSEAARAGYLLGSLSEARGQAASALNWYEGYLREAPSGPFAAEAQAGRMRALHALGRHTDAHRAASEYLRRYPSGTSAATARRILNQQ